MKKKPRSTGKPAGKIRSSSPGTGANQLVAATKIILFGGKGGVGKTSAAAATALALAYAGKKVLIVSSDPAPSLSDIFEIPIGSRVTQVSGTLSAIEMNAEAVMEKYKKIYGGAIIDALATVIPVTGDVLDDIPNAVVPGFDELFALEEVLAFRSAGYDYLIWDTAPTGHTLRLLSLPDTIIGYTSGMQKIQERLAGVISTLREVFDREPSREPLVSALSKLQNTARHALAVLTDHEHTEFVLVIIPEALALYQTERFMAVLERLDICTARIIVNGLIPENTCPFCRARRRVQERYLAKIHEAFDSRLAVIEVPLFPGEMKGQKQLVKYAAYLGWDARAGRSSSPRAVFRNAGVAS
ncbi:MAG: arsenical pump-driving ATPase GET3 [Methanoregula sp.]|nr:arsenical pump-driving ATPase GET3 [Methanoregula sp.]